MKAPGAAEATALPRLLKGVSGDRDLVSVDSHLREHGPLPDLRRCSVESVIDEIAQSGLRGHGGASFPAAVKMRSVGTRVCSQRVCSQQARREVSSGRSAAGGQQRAVSGGRSAQPRLG